MCLGAILVGLGEGGIYSEFCRDMHCVCGEMFG